MIRKLIRTAATLWLLGTLFSIARPYAAHWTTDLTSSATIKHLVRSAAGVTPISRPTHVVSRNMSPVLQKTGDPSLAAFPLGSLSPQGEPVSIPSAISNVLEALRQRLHNDYHPVRKETR